MLLRIYFVSKYLTNFYYRISEIQTWTNYLKVAIEKIEKMITLLDAEKNSVEMEVGNLTAVINLLEDYVTVSLKCYEMKPDIGINELNTEICVMLASQKLLSDQVEIVRKKIDHLDDVKRILQREICDKNAAMQVDLEQLRMDKNNPNLIDSRQSNDAPIKFVL